MFGQIQYFSKGTVYRIRNRKTGKCLSHSIAQLTTKATQENSNQLWIVSQIKNGQFEIIQMRTGEVMSWSQSKGELKLQKGKMKDNQLWELDRAEIVKDINYFWIRPIKNNINTLSASALSQKVKVSDIDPTLNICLWEFVICSPTQAVLNELSVLRSQVSKLVLDLPQHSSKQGTNIIQYLFHGCGNQRWTIQAYLNQKVGSPKEYTIRNYCSGMHLTACFSKGGFKVIQTVFNCGPDQRWLLIPVKDNIFVIQSVSNNNYFLGVNSDKGGSSATMTQDRQKSRWIVQGYYPAV